MLQFNANTKYKQRSNEEWLAIIQECRSSGLSDRAWCEQNHINPSSFYYSISRLRKAACNIPEHQKPVACEKQEVVEVSDPDLLTRQDHYHTFNYSCKPEDTAVHLMYHGLHLQFTNNAARETIENILSVLHDLC